MAPRKCRRTQIAGKQPSLSPEQALAEIEAGKPARDAFANLDLAQCQFHDEVDTTGYTGPVVKMEGFGGVAKGHLALTPETAKKYEESGTPYITVYPDRNHKFANKKELEPSAMTIFGSSPAADTIFIHADHFALGIETQGMTWLRNLSIVHHYASTPSEKNSISIGDMVFHEGDLVTMDARTGQLYPSDLPIKSIPDAVRALDAKAKEKALPDFAVMANVKNYMSVNDAATSSAQGIGLYRTEDIVRGMLVVIGNNNFADDVTMDELLKITQCNMSGRIHSKPQMQAAMEDFMTDEKQQQFLTERLGGRIESELLRPFYFSNQDQGFPHKQYPLTWRLSALESFVPELSDDRILTPANKKRFLTLQAEGVLSRLSIEDGSWDKIMEPVRILIPSIRSAEELAEIKTEIDAIAKKHGFITEAGEHKFKFGAMIETKEAVEPEEAARIAKLCDFVSFGTNDLTKDITGLKRDDLDASAKAAAKAYMTEKGYTGESPFDTLVPAVAHKMEAAIKAMRAANPNIKIGCCGRQVAANPQAIETALNIGLDNISVPPQDVAASRIIAAHYAARKELTRAAGR